MMIYCDMGMPVRKTSGMIGTNCVGVCLNAGFTTDGMIARMLS